MDETQTPRERRHERTKEAILTAARELIAEQGADNLSLRAIARRIDYSPAALYEYFDSREEIIDALCLRGDSQLNNYLKRVPTDLPLETYFVQLMEAYLDFARQNPELYAVMFHQLTIGFNHVPEEFLLDDSFTILARAVERGINEGLFQAGENYGVFEISYNLWAMVHGMAMLQLRYLRDLEFDFKSADRKAVQVFLKGLKQPGT